jgi:1-acyl-sn-glycerol-3-phosphate acyltransferase
MSQSEAKTDETAAPSNRERGASVALKPQRSLFSYASFNTLFAGSLSGTLADRLYQMSLIAAALIIFADGPRKVAQIQIVGTIPGLLLYAASGSLVDSFDRRRLMMVIKGLKIFVVLLFVPLLWAVTQLNAEHRDPALQASLEGRWLWCLGTVVLLNIISVPFSPARAAAIPDVAPDEHRSLGASLMATTGLISLLLGTFIGGELASSSWGPARTILISSCLYAVAAFLFSRLPDAVAVPGNKRPKQGAPEEAIPEGDGVGSYLKGMFEGLAYCIKRPSVLGLIYFECVFWTVGSAFYVLILFHAEKVLGLTGNDETRFFSRALGCAGVGLFTGAIGVGKICRKTSPIVTYTPAFILLSCGLFGVFHSQPVNGIPGTYPGWIFPVMLALGLGGGMVLGRVDADVLATADAEIRGRVFSLKAMAFAATILVTMLTITEAGLSDATLKKVIQWIPLSLFISLPLVFVLSWIIDIAIWSKRGDTELPGPLHRLGYRVLRAMFRFIFIVLFRYESKGRENVPKTGPVVLAANHASFIDPMLLGCAVDRPVQYIIYSAYYRSFAHPIFRFLRCIPVDEKDNLGALKAGVRSLNQNACIGIFPEGRVSADGQLNPPMRGALFMAQRAGAQVVPVALKGNFEAFPRAAIVPRMSKIMPIVGKPFPVPKELSKKEMAELTDKLMADLAKELDRPPPPTTADKIQ